MPWGYDQNQEDCRGKTEVWETALSLVTFHTCHLFLCPDLLDLTVRVLQDTSLYFNSILYLCYQVSYGEASNLTFKSFIH